MNNKTYTKSKISLTIKDETKEIIKKIAVKEYRDLSKQVEMILDRFVENYLKENKID